MADDGAAALDEPSHRDGARTIDRDAAIAATRERIGDQVDASDDEIWALWERHDGGPTNGDDLGRVVAELEGIAVDG